MALTIGNISNYTDDNAISHVEADITIGDNIHRLWFKSKTPLIANNNSFLIASLYAAMKSGVNIRIDTAISEKLSNNIPRIQEIFHGWFPEFEKISCDFSEVTKTQNPNTGVGCFFTGGVDSFYSALKHKNEITHLVFVYGLDIKLDDHVLRETVSVALNKISSELGKPLVEIETNLREITNQYGDWGPHYHSTGLASIAHILTSTINKVFIPASLSYNQLFPWGGHPMIDPLWSTEELEIVHDGCEFGRMQKVEYISRFEIPMKWLRVCYENTNSEYNCCVCEKCLRTMASLRAVDALDRCMSFNTELDLDLLVNIPIENPAVRSLLDENIEYIQKKGTDPELENTLKKCAILNDSKYSIRKLSSNLIEYSQFKDWKEQRNVLLRKLWDADKKWMFKESIKEIIKTILGK